MNLKSISYALEWLFSSSHAFDLGMWPDIEDDTVGSLVFHLRVKIRKKQNS